MSRRIQCELDRQRILFGLRTYIDYSGRLDWVGFAVGFCWEVIESATNGFHDTGALIRDSHSVCIGISESSDAISAFSSFVFSRLRSSIRAR